MENDKFKNEPVDVWVTAHIIIEQYQRIGYIQKIVHEDNAWSRIIYGHIQPSYIFDTQHKSTPDLLLLRNKAEYAEH